MLILEPGDEVILPSWAFPSCANAIILRGATPVFVDVDEDLNIDIDQIVPVITDKTKAIMPLHYAGVVCDMHRINAIAENHGLYVIEDAAQALGNWKVSGDLGCLSFHSTKNVQCGEGGALIVNSPTLIEKAEIIRDFGTTKAQYLRGGEKMEWLSVGSSYRMSSYLAEVLIGQLEKLPEITAKRRERWNQYAQVFNPRKGCKKIANGHIFWLYVEDKWDWLKTMKNTGYKVSSHFEALHLTPPGRKYGRAGRITRATEAMQKLVKFSTHGG